MIRVVVLADTDSRWKWGAALAHHLKGATVEGILLTGRATPNARQLADTGVEVDTLLEATLVEAIEASVDADVVILACVGGTVQAAIHAYSVAAGNGRRPVLVTGYVGVVYERTVDGLLLRVGADVIVANSAYDERIFRQILRDAGADEDTIVQARLPFLGGVPYEPSEQRPLTVCFATQPSSPASRPERVYLLRRAIDHARSNPDRRVLVKLRSQPHEQTTHIEEHHYAELAKSLGELPSNLEFRYGLMDEVLDTTDLLVTVSSTAAVESASRGIPTGILTDLGVRERLGNHWFLGSGALVSWDELDDLAIPRVQAEWAQDRGIASAPGDDSDGFDELRTTVDRLCGSARGPLVPWYTVRRSTAYLPKLLRRAGLHPEPAYTGTDYVTGFGDRLRRRGRHVVRRMARRVYRVSVRRIEPTLRRWGQL